MINVKAFGAVGDGVNVDTVAIQSAINSLSDSGGAVFFPTGTYIIDNSLVIAISGISLIGERETVTGGTGVRIAATGTDTSGFDNIDVFDSCFQIKNITLEGKGSFTAGTLLEFTGASKSAVIENCTFTGGYNLGLR